MGLREDLWLTISCISPGQIFTPAGTRGTPHMRTHDGYINLVTREKIVIERGQSVTGKPLTMYDIMRKYRMSHVQYDGWLDYIENKVKPNFVKEDG